MGGKTIVERGGGGRGKETGGALGLRTSNKGQSFPPNWVEGISFNLV
jgi:hypothetical protein